MGPSSALEASGPPGGGLYQLCAGHTTPIALACGATIANPSKVSWSSGVWTINSAALSSARAMTELLRAAERVLPSLTCATATCALRAGGRRGRWDSYAHY